MEIDITQYLVATAALIGLVNGLAFAFERNWRAFTLFLIAVIGGAVFGFLQWFSLPSIEIGLLVGLNSSGVYKVAQKLGGK